jgi:Cellulase (glycosyl hydrolase family 5)
MSSQNLAPAQGTMLGTLRLNTSTRALAVAAIALLAVLSLIAAPRAHAARGMEVALEDEPVFLNQFYYNRDQAFQQARALGVTRLRINIGWGPSLGGQQNLRFPPSAPKYNFAKIDNLVDAANQYGIRIQMTLTGPAPAFATGTHRVGAYQPNAKYFGKFAAAVAAHFRGRVDRYSIWNEPNYVGWLAPLRQQPSLYRALYIAGYKAIKTADRGAKVFIGETAPYSIRRLATSPIAFLRAVTCVDGSYHHVRGCTGPRTLRADGYAHHPYDFKHPPNYRYPGADNATLGTTKNLTRALDKLKKAKVLKPNRGSHMPLYFTEYGYFASGRRRIADSKRARWLPQAFAMALKMPRVKQMLQYLLVQPPSKLAAGAFFDLSIVSSSGHPESPFNALLAWSQQAQAAHQILVPGGPFPLPQAPPGSAPAVGRR